MAVSQKTQEVLEAFETGWSPIMQSTLSSVDCDDGSSDLRMTTSDLSDEIDVFIISNAGSAEAVNNEDDYVNVSLLVSRSGPTNEQTSLLKVECAEEGEKVETGIESTAFHEENRQRAPRTVQHTAIDNPVLHSEVDAVIPDSSRYCTRAGPTPVAQYQEFMTSSSDVDHNVNACIDTQTTGLKNVTGYTDDVITGSFARIGCSHGFRDKLQCFSLRHSDRSNNEGCATHALAGANEKVDCPLGDGVPSFNAGPPGFLPAITDITPSAATQREAVISDFAEHIRDDLKSKTRLCVSNMHDSRRAAHGKIIEDYEARLLAKDAEIFQLASKNREHVKQIEKMDAFLIEKEGDHIWQIDRIIERMSETEAVAKLEMTKLTERLRKAEIERDQISKHLEKAERSVDEATGTLDETTTFLDEATALVGVTDKKLVERTIQLENAEIKLSGIELEHEADKARMYFNHVSDLTQLRKRGEKMEKELKKALTNAEDELEHKAAQLAIAETAYKTSLTAGLKDSEDRIAELHAAFDQVRVEMESKISELKTTKDELALSRKYAKAIEDLLEEAGHPTDSESFQNLIRSNREIQTSSTVPS